MSQHPDSPSSGEPRPAADPAPGDAPVRLEQRGGVATITLHRPDALNALTVRAKELLLAAVRDSAADPEVRVVVLRGTGRAFCAGQDLREHVTQLRAGSPETAWRTVPEHFTPLARTLAEMDKPYVAAVNGVAAGAGAALAFLADIRLVAASAGFDLAFTRIALSCDTGTSWTLPRLVGPTRALDLLLRPRTVSASESLDLGIATEVVADDAFDARVQEVADALAQGPTLAYAAVRHAVAHGLSASLPEALETEAELMRRTGASADHRAAVEAFVAKRPARFTGR